MSLLENRLFIVILLLTEIKYLLILFLPERTFNEFFLFIFLLKIFFSYKLFI